MAKGEGNRSVEDIQREIAEVELETKRLMLAEQKKRNAEFIAAEEQRHKSNKQRMTELEQGRKTMDATQRKCRHMSGGKPSNILRGGGVGSFSILTRAIMPDGVTVLLQCSRCRLKLYPPTERDKKADPKKYLDDLKRYNELLEQASETDLEPLRGPTFLFKNAEGVPLIPERV